MATEADLVDNLLNHSVEEAWNKAASGTYASTDKKLFRQAFKAGWHTGRRSLRLEVEANAANCKDDCYYVE